MHAIRFPDAATHSLLSFADFPIEIRLHFAQPCKIGSVCAEQSRAQVYIRSHAKRNNKRDSRWNEAKINANAIEHWMHVSSILNSIAHTIIRGKVSNLLLLTSSWVVFFYSKQKKNSTMISFFCVMRYNEILILF